MFDPDRYSNRLLSLQESLCFIKSWFYNYYYKETSDRVQEFCQWIFFVVFNFSITLIFLSITSLQPCLLFIQTLSIKISKLIRWHLWLLLTLVLNQEYYFFFKYNSILDYLWIFFMILVKNKKFLIFFTNEYVFLITKN